MPDPKCPFEDDHRWSNNACLGYLLLATDRLGYNDEETSRLMHAMMYAFDMKTIEEAEKTYLNS